MKKLKVKNENLKVRRLDSAQENEEQENFSLITFHF